MFNLNFKFFKSFTKINLLHKHVLFYHSYIDNLLLSFSKFPSLYII